MNFLDADFRHEGDQLFAEGDGFRIVIPAEHASQLATTSGQVVLGIRPSDLNYDPNARDELALDLRVTVSEYIGAQSVLMCACGNTSVTVELKSETPIALGETLRFAVRPEGIHLFDRTTEAAL